MNHWDNYEVPEPQDLPCEWCGKIESEQYGYYVTVEQSKPNHFLCSDACAQTYLASVKVLLRKWTSSSTLHLDFLNLDLL